MLTGIKVSIEAVIYIVLTWALWKYTYRFLEKVSTLLSGGAVLTILTDNAGAMEEALKKVRDFMMEDSFLLNERAGTTEFILKYK